jgi:hypothetical protein
LHISKESEIADHCCQFALSDHSKEYAVTCQHEHNQVCRKCDDLREILTTIDKASEEVRYDSADKEDDTIYTVAQVQIVSLYTSLLDPLLFIRNISLLQSIYTFKWYMF